MTAVYWIWGVTLGLITFVVVPLALHLLHRVFRAARHIERYAREALAAGARIAHNTAAISALDETVAAAGSLLEATKLLKKQTDEIGDAAVDLAQKS